MAENKILLAADGKAAFKFTFSTDNGKITGRVSVARRGGGPDVRTAEEKVKAAKTKINDLASELTEAASKDRYAKGP